MSLLKDHLPVELVLAIHFKSFNSFLSSHFAFPFSDICVCVSSKHLSLPNFYNILLVYFAHYICISPMGKLQDIRFFFFDPEKEPLPEIHFTKITYLHNRPTFVF